MKKMAKYLRNCILVAIVLVVVGVIALRMAFPPEKVKQLILTYAQENLHREITFDKISFNLIGVTLNNFSMSEVDSFEKGTFIKANELTAKVALKPLFSKHIDVTTLKLNGLDVNVIKQKDGSFNFESLMVKEETTSETSAIEKQETTTQEQIDMPLTVFAKKLEITDGDFVYQDLQSGLSTSINDLNIIVDNFSLSDLFGIAINFTTQVKQVGMPDIAVPVVMDLKVNLADLNLDNAVLNIEKIQANYKDLVVKLTGNVKNFVAPEVSMQGSMEGISDKLVKDFLPEISSFWVPTVDVTVLAKANLDDSKVIIENLAIKLGDNSVKVNGQVGWGGENPTYKLVSDISINLAEVLQMVEVGNEFKPEGTILGNLKATEKNDYQDVSGTVTLKSISALYDVFVLKQTNGVIKFNSLNDISSDNLNGLLNNEKFKSSFSYKNVKDVMNVVFDLDVDALTLDKLPTTQETVKEEATAVDADSAGKAEKDDTTQSDFLLNLTTNLKIGKIKVPYFTSEGFVAMANLTNINSAMDKMSGKASFGLQSGSITDVDAFIKGNKIGKIILLPIAIVNKVAKTLNVQIFSKDSADIPFVGAKGEYTFTNGLMTLDKTVFDSKLASINASGTANFATNELNMKANANLFNGNAPIALKIGGMIDNPSGKLDVVNTVTSLVSGLLGKKDENNSLEETKNSAKETISSVKEAGASAIKSIGSLFKK